MKVRVVKDVKEREPCGAFKDCATPVNNKLSPDWKVTGKVSNEFNNT